MPRFAGGPRLARALALLLAPALVMLTAATTGAVAAGSGPADIEPIGWTSCADPAAAQFHAQCAELAVPLDWAAVNGPTTTLALLRIPATGPAGGTVLADSEDLGGYGGSQIAFFLQHGAHYLGRLAHVHAGMDIVIVDPRGRGGSSPLRCPVPGHDPTVSTFPATVADYQRLASHNASAFEACRAANGPLATQTGLRVQARDIDAVRTALGQRTLNWIGQATGGELGVVYAALFPQRTGRMVLDTVVDPYRPASARVLDAALAEETAFAHFASWCESAPTGQCALQGRDPGRVFDEVVAKAAEGRVDGGMMQRPLTAQEVRIAAGQFAVGYPAAWPLLATAIASADDAGDGAVLGDYVALSYDDPDYTANRTQACVDQPTGATGPAGYRHLRALADEMRAVAPHTGGSSFAWDVFTGCLGWPHSGPPLADTLPARIRPSSTILVTATTGDPINPYVWGLDVAERLAGSRLLTAAVDGHGSLDNSLCAATAIDDYVSTGALPPSGTRCRT